VRTPIKATAREPINRSNTNQRLPTATPHLRRAAGSLIAASASRLPFCIARPGHGSLRGQSYCRNIWSVPEHRHCKVHNGLTLDHVPTGSPRNCLTLALGRYFLAIWRCATRLPAAEPSGTARLIARHCAGLPTACAPRPPVPCLNPRAAQSPRLNPLAVAIASHDGGSQLPPRT